MFNSEIKQPQFREMKATLPSHCCLRLPPWTPNFPIDSPQMNADTAVKLCQLYKSVLKYSFGLLYRDGY